MLVGTQFIEISGRYETVASDVCRDTVTVEHQQDTKLTIEMYEN
jgi:hypothetical protein